MIVIRAGARCTLIAGGVTLPSAGQWAGSVLSDCHPGGSLSNLIAEVVSLSSLPGNTPLGHYRHLGCCTTPSQDRSPAPTHLRL